MIDTVILSIPKYDADITHLRGADVPPWELQSRTSSYEKYVKNPAKSSAVYYPKLTGYKRKASRITWERMIRIEFSAPKLIFKNNIDELTDAQFEDVVHVLHNRLKEWGLVIPERRIENMTVSAVHYSKNIELQNGYTSQYVISELNKINPNKWFDLSRVRFTNDGQSLQIYSQAHSFVIYDKIADLVRGKKRSIDREQTPYQLSLFEPLAKIQEPREILRMEVRLSQKRKMNALFKKLGFAENPTFKDVFDTNKSRAVLTHYWETMMSGDALLLFGHALTTKDLFKQILLAHRGIKTKEAIYRLGLVWLVRDGNGMRELRSILEKHAKDRTWYRRAADAQETQAALTKLKPREWYNQIQKVLKSYPLFRI